jgi:hypothetical protein
MADTNIVEVPTVDGATSKPASLQTQIELVRELKTYDHKILSSATVETYAKAFNFPISCYAQNVEEMYEPEGDLMGLGSHQLAETLCHRLRVKYDRKHGIGSALRECCCKLLLHLESALPKEDV